MADNNNSNNNNNLLETELKKTEDTVVKHSSGVTFSLAEKITFVKYVNDVMKRLHHEAQTLASDEQNTTGKNLLSLLQQFEPFDEGTEASKDANHDEFFARFSSGVILSLLLFNLNSAIMDIKTVETNVNQTFKMIENNRRVLQSAKNLGFILVNIDPQQLFDGKPMPILSLLSQIVRHDFTDCIRLNNSIQMIYLKKPEESIRSFLQLDPKELIVRWINFVLENDPESEGLQVSNIGTDFKNSVAYMRLIRNVAPNIVMEEDVNTILSIEDLKERAVAFIEKTESLNLSKRIFITANDIVTGKVYSNIALLGSIFNDFGVASLSDHFEMDPQEMLDLRCQILDITVEELQKHMPEVRSTEFLEFVAAAKSLSKSTKSDSESNTGVLKELRNVQATATGLQHQIESIQMAKDKETEERIQELKLEHEAQLKEMEEREQQLKLEHEAQLKEMEERFQQLKLEHETQLAAVKDEFSKQLSQLDSEKSVYKTRVEEIQLENTKLQSNITDFEETKRSLQSASDQMSEDKVSLEKELQHWKDRYTQSKKEVSYILNNIITDFQSEIKLATWKFGSIKIQDLLKRCAMKGYVRKRSNGVVKNWKNRYWVLVENYIFYFEDQKDNSKLKGILRLDDCRVEGYDRFAKEKKEDERNGFVVYTSKRKMKTQVDNIEENAQWKQAIAHAASLY